MAFDLIVQFSGLCLYVLDETNQRVGVLMPDARKTVANMVHEDGTIGTPHVGYLRFDLGNLHPNFPAATVPEDPTNEGVHQFAAETLQFVIGGGAAGAIVANDINVPKFEELAPDRTVQPGDPPRSLFKVRDGLFTGPNPSEVLMRTILEGGTIEGEPEENWLFNNLFNPGKPAYVDEFAPVVVWTRPGVESLTIRLQRFAGGDPIEFSLAPPEGSEEPVRLKIANLCEINPLEWQNLGLRAVDKDDVDFKWIYRLLTPANGDTWPQALLDGHRFPIPMLPPPADLGDEGVEDCIGAQIKGSTT